MAKWMLYVVMRSVAKRSWSAAKVALVAISRVGVVPGVKTEDQRFGRKSAMSSTYSEVESTINVLGIEQTSYSWPHYVGRSSHMSIYISGCYEKSRICDSS